MKATLLSVIIAATATLAACKPNPSGQATAGDTRVEVIFDNANPRTMPLELFGEVPDTIVTRLGIEGGVPASVSVMAVRRAGKNILFDAGNGNKDSQLMTWVTETFTQPEAVDYIFLTHLHGDHIGGLLKDGQRAFANAQVYIPAAELDAWTSREGGAPQNVAAILQAYGESIVKFTPTDELPCGIRAVPMPGHTPGHTGYRVDNALIAGDLMHGVALQQAHPEFCARYDMDPSQAVETRKRVLELAANEGLDLYGMHFPTAGPLVIQKNDPKP